MDMNKEEAKFVMASWTDKDDEEHSGIYPSKDMNKLRNQLSKWKRSKQIKKFAIIKVEGYGG